MPNKNEISIDVVGEPAPQGSKRHVGGGVLIESSAKVKPWRQAVAWACKEAAQLWNWKQTDEPVLLAITFTLPRPRGHYNKKGKLLPSAPAYPHRKPDLDKLLRATFDGITDSNCIYTDDARVVGVKSTKFYAVPNEELGAKIVAIVVDESTEENPAE